jgi:peptidyl-prolyl cis-trans isomerase SurA
MQRKCNSLVLVGLHAVFSIGALSQPQTVVDGVVAVVGDEIITKSELQQMAQYYSIQMGLDPLKQEKEFLQLKHEILQNLISDRVLLAKAKEDTITADDSKVEAELDRRIQSLVQQLGSEQKVEAQFGAPIKKIKRDNREEVRRMLIVGELQGKKFRSLQVSRREVEAFYETVKDSLPSKKPMVRLRHILVHVRPGESSREQALSRILSLKEKLKQGERFEDLATEYSEDPGTSRRGGDLGFVEKGTLFPSFEEAAFRLQPGEISDFVETPIGFHLIQLVEKRGDQVHVRHLLIRIEKSDEDQQAVRKRIESVRERALAGEDFAKLAVECSDDSSTKGQGGELGWYAMDDFQVEEFKNAVDTLDMGEITKPFETQFGYHLVQLEDKKGARKYNLEEDYEEFRTRAIELKRQKLRNQWIEELKKSIYIDVKEDLL